VVTFWRFLLLFWLLFLTAMVLVALLR